MHSRAILDPELLPTAGRRWDATILGMLVALLAFAPITFGAVEAWSQIVVIAIAAALAICLALRVIFDREFRRASTWLYWPLGLFIALAALQCTPLPDSVVRVVSLATLATRQELIGNDSIANTTLSFYPRATIEHLRLVLVGTAVFVVVASTIRTTWQIKFLLSSIFGIGCAEAILSIAQMATATDKIYWFVPTGRRMVTSGSFINYSHYCQFMNLALGAGVALFLLNLHEQRRHEAGGVTWGGALARINWDKQAPLLAGIILCAVTVLTSMSRNGAISMFVAAAVVGAALYRRGSLSWRGWLLGAVPLAVVAVLLIVGFDLVYERLATLSEVKYFQDRWQLTLDTLRAWRRFPLWGTGLGTHEVVFPMFDTSVTPALAAHADNDYAQLLEEMGLAGAALVLAFLIGITAIVCKLAVRGRTSSSMAAFGLAFGLIAVAIHSATDFGQRIPAVFCLSAAACGLLVAIFRMESRRAGAPRGKSPGAIGSSVARRVTAVAALIGLIAIWGWAARRAYASYLGERWWAAALATESRIRNEPHQATDDDYRELIAAANAAVASDPANVQYRYWLNSYRWESISRAVDPDTGQAMLHPDALPLVSQIADELAAVRRFCPTYGPPYALEGQLRLLVLNDPLGAELIRKGARLARYDAPTCLAAGQQAVREGRLKEAEPLLRRAVDLQPGYFRQVVDIYLLEADRPDLARSLAGDDYWRLGQLADASSAIPAHAHWVDELRQAAASALRRRVADSTARPGELAALARIEHAAGNRDAAIELYRSALSHDYRQIDWHLGLAQVFADANQLEEAIGEVRIGLRMRPQHPRATKLLEDLIARREAIQN